MKSKEVFVFHITSSGSDAETAAKCPDGFPNYERHTGCNNGDVCRNEKMHGLNVGWNCLPGCFGQDSAPWCVKNGTESSPCRAGKMLSNTIIFMICVMLTFDDN